MFSELRDFDDIPRYLLSSDARLKGSGVKHANSRAK